MNRGFTLLEVLVAMAVLAVALGAIIQAAGSSASNVAYLRERTVASWIARNQINELLLDAEWPGIGTRRGETAMAGRRWRWQVRVSQTSDEDLRRLDVAVFGAAAETPVVELAAFERRVLR